MPLNVNELKQKVFIIYEDQPYIVTETRHLKMQQRRPTVMVKMRNLVNGKVLERNFAQSDTFQEADVEKRQVKFLYSHRDQFWFSNPDDPSKRFELSEDVLGDSIKYLKPNTVLEAVLLEDKVISIELPIKMDFKVVEAPPAIRGNTAQGGMKLVVINTGASINAPLFIEQGDTIRINTQTGEYAERVEKAK